MGSDTDKSVMDMQRGIDQSKDKHVASFKIRNVVQRVLVFASMICLLVFAFLAIFRPSTRELVLCNLNSIIGALLCLLLVFALGYYFDTLLSRPRDYFARIFLMMGKDIIKVFSWVFSLDGFFVLLVAAVIWLVYTISTHLTGSHGEVSNGIQVLSITLTITLSTLIPSLIAKIIAKNHMNSIIDHRLNIELKKFKTSLINIRKDKGHASRMSAVLLEQMAGSVQASDTESVKRLRQDNAAWAIGWGSEAIIQYVLIQEDYSNALKNSASCINVINQAASHILKADNNTIQSAVKARDFKSLITMHALIRQTEVGEMLQSMAKAQRGEIKKEDNTNTAFLCQYGNDLDLEQLLKTIEDAFYNKLAEKDRPKNWADFCTITGMPQEFNDQLNKKAKDIQEERSWK